MNINRKITVLLTLLALTCFWSIHVAANNPHSEISIIPKPASVRILDEDPFEITESMQICYNPQLEEEANYLEETLEYSTGFHFRMKSCGKISNGIILELDKDSKYLKSNAEAYILSVEKKRVSIKASSSSGIFYGIQSFLQLLPSEIYNCKTHRGILWTAPSLLIYDAPERPWRGMMIDVARYFYDIDFLKKYIDMMAMYKMNVLQLHMIDDAGWRLEIKKYPKLTEQGAWAHTGTPKSGGYYTQEEIKDLVSYAQIRGVEIIPEIEFPAHILSAIVAYPWLSCSEEELELPPYHYISNELLCLGKETTYKFLEDVMDEVVSLFPSKYIHVGGDEAVYTRWETCPRCQNLKKELGLAKTSDLQNYLTNRVVKMLARKGRTVVGWEELVMSGPLERPIVGMMWHNVPDTLIAAQTGNKAVIIPNSHVYFDMPASSSPGELQGSPWQAPISVEKVYSIPINDYSDKSTVIGVQGAFWGDQLIHWQYLQNIPYLNENRSQNYCEYLTFPRLLALSEVAWGREKDRNFEDFQERLSKHYQKLEQKGCNYRVPEPIIKGIKKVNGGFEFSLECPIEGRLMRYTTDGTCPNIHSTIYTEPVVVQSPNDFKAITVAESRHFSLPYRVEPDWEKYEKYGTPLKEWTKDQIRLEPERWIIDCTGKIVGNYKYQISFVQFDGRDKVSFGDLNFKERDKIVTTVLPQSIDEENGIVTYELELKDYVWVTHSLDVEVTGIQGSDSSGCVFYKRIN